MKTFTVMKVAMITEKKLKKLISQDEFYQYRKIFTRFGFGLGVFLHYSSDAQNITPSSIIQD